MRIRNLKPEFWTSEDIAALDWKTRLIFIGMLSYVDDNGVGRDVENLITSSLMPLEEDVAATRLQITCSLQQLHSAGLLHRYTVNGRPFLEISGWTRHQYIPRPNKPRYPRHDAENAVNMQPATNDMQSTADSHRVSEGQGVRVSEGQPLVLLRNYSHQDVSKISQQDKKKLTHRILSTFTETVPNVKFPSKTLNDLAAQINVSIQDGIDHKHIARGLELWNEAGYPATTLHTSIVQAQREANGGNTYGTPKARRATGTERAISTLQMGMQLEQEVEDNADF